MSTMNASSSLAYRGRTTWLFIKYQLLTKGLLSLFFYPIYRIILDYLLAQSGRTVLSSGDFVSFLLSFNGLGLMLVTLVMMIVLIGLDVNSFILISALIREGRIEMTARHMIWVGLKSLKQFLSPAGLIMMIYISLIFLLLGIGITVSPMKDFQIPNFITSVIYGNPVYIVSYSVVLLMLTYISYRFIFVFHYILIMGSRTFDALKQSVKLTRKYGKQFLKDFSLGLLKWIATIYIPASIIFGLLIFILLRLADHQHDFRFLLFFILISLGQVIAFSTFLLTPVIILNVTTLFYDYHQKEGQPIQLKIPVKASAWEKNVPHKIKWRSKVGIAITLVLLLAFNLSSSFFFTYFFEDIFNQKKQNIAIIAHRGGGDLGAENTIEGIEEAAKEGVSWTEIDIQRTKDGSYVLNHDGDFQRVSGESRTSSEMTLAEIKTLTVKNHFDPSKVAQPIPTIEEVIEAAKGKIGLFMELKGKTADTKMVDDMVSLIKAEHIEDKAVLLSLDYQLIEYIETTYPEIQSGYLYYFALGQIEHLLGDYLIMEEREATSDKVDLLKAKGKKVVVWTVNTDESINTFVNSDVDGIITDYVLAVKDGIKKRDERSDLELIMDSLFG
ncbi:MULTISPECIES: glycerophosphodiester phosphodiesterase family protein [unclassified Streptococcus]|uniref:glycerophosphodiester phosphodiesterase family protein n=1 Tax=unclassified Streptococcus TaxID=2608887 RepID=UPI001071E304|nr:MULTISPECIES: glycerophosphodiester phosphodiesterase family protein [unclassified Streptococcus]MBF0787150.1 glycerophosphoryl diester phosphodiesterase membrane domain-containing protein [Streptococcus sp. 19428wC2_LYSM12]MCQ9212134.1 glycerophosphoryl diester phosphodiesterase membrane domain-containing protein [Streptococcus sp. B01]MCQ9213463.1 glycerophosphoryl diester phosphodiesterase membrane domain-containing protein [Streptococcus sp. O1]TFV05905.1 glycosyltransferase [Streptococc